MQLSLPDYMTNDAETLTPHVNSPGARGGRRTRSEIATLLALAPSASVVAVADACVASTEQPTLLSGPEVGTVVLTVREPVEKRRFHLAEVLVTRVEVEHRGTRGWAMRMGEDDSGALAAAICDAEAAAGGDGVDLVEELCAATERAESRARTAEWNELEPTIVRFEELS